MGRVFQGPEGGYILFEKLGTVAPNSLILKEALSFDRVSEDLARVREFKPDFAYSYASSTYMISRYLHHCGETIPLKGVITTSDMLFPHYRDLIESVFECRVFNNYGCNDGGAWGAECDEHAGFHHDFERSIIEFDRDGKMYVTDLWNYAMPLIRYENGDRGCWLPRCKCGRGMPLFDITGGLNDFIVLPERIISPVTVSGLLRTPLILDFRLVQHSPDHFVLDYEPYPGSTDEKCREAMGPLLELLEGCTVEIERVDAIERPLSNKQVAVENRCLCRDRYDPLPDVTMETDPA